MSGQDSSLLRAKVNHILRIPPNLLIILPPPALPFVSRRLFSSPSPFTYTCVCLLHLCAPYKHSCPFYLCLTLSAHPVDARYLSPVSLGPRFL